MATLGGMKNTTTAAPIFSESGTKVMPKESTDTTE